MFHDHSVVHITNVVLARSGLGSGLTSATDGSPVVPDLDKDGSGLGSGLGPGLGAAGCRCCWARSVGWDRLGVGSGAELRSWSCLEEGAEGLNCIAR